MKAWLIFGLFLFILYLLYLGIIQFVKNIIAFIIRKKSGSDLVISSPSDVDDIV